MTAQTNPKISGLQTDSADADLSILKIASFIALVSISAFGSGYFLATIQVFYAFISLSLFLVLFSLQTIFIKSWTRIIPAVVLEVFFLSLPILVVLKNNLNIYLWSAIGLLLIFLFWAEVDGRSETRNFLKIHFWRVSKTVLLKSITAVLLFTIFIYVSLANVSTDNDYGNEISEAINVFIAPAIKIFVPEFSYESPLKNIIVDILTKQGVPQESISFATNEFKKNIDNMFGIDLDLNETIGNSVYAAIKDKINKMLNSGNVYALLPILIILWFMVRGIAFILFIPLSFISFLLYELSIITNFAVIQYESRSREIVLLP